MPAVVLWGAMSMAGAVDRHVYLDVNGDGTLNDCPNPTHNALGTSNTNNLQYCQGGTSAGKVVGTATGTVSSSTCTGGGGTVRPVTNGIQADVDRDGANETVYGHPQACVWSMGLSDSCEVHAGTYRKAGAVADNYSGDLSDWGGTSGACSGYNCWFSTVVAYGRSGSGYGTPAAPGYLRGAVMQGSTDTWDSDGDKIPDTVAGEPTSYPVVFNGDLNNNGTFDISSCNGGPSGSTYNGSCTGDAFSMLVIGCGRGPSYTWCKSGYTGNEHGVFVDTDANGTFETHFATSTQLNPEWLTVKDIEFTRYNGGTNCQLGSSTCGAGARQAHPTEGHILLNGDGSTAGMTIDHIYPHDNDFSWDKTSETAWALFADPENYSCGAGNWLVIRNSYIVSNNLNVMNADGSGPKGCNLRFHDNRVVTDVTSPRASGSDIKYAFAYWKNYQTSGGGAPLVRRIYNNEFIVKRGPAGWHLVDFGGFTDNSPGPELWFYGNILRCDPATHSTASCIGGTWLPPFCHGTSTGSTGKWKSFNNTFDFDDGIGCFCRDGSSACTSATSGTGYSTLVVEKNNAYYGTTRVHETQAASEVYGGEVCTGAFGNCTQASSSRSTWFSPGSYAANNPDTWHGVSNYVAKAGGPLDAAGSCDPDGDGATGVDYDGNGVNDVVWFDLAGTRVDCQVAGTKIDAGAVQSGGTAPGDTVPPGTVTGVTRIDKH